MLPERTLHAKRAHPERTLHPKRAQPRVRVYIRVTPVMRVYIRVYIRVTPVMRVYIQFTPGMGFTVKRDHNAKQHGSTCGLVAASVTTWLHDFGSDFKTATMTEAVNWPVIEEANTAIQRALRNTAITTSDTATVRYSISWTSRARLRMLQINFRGKPTTRQEGSFRSPLMIFCSTLSHVMSTKPVEGASQLKNSSSPTTRTALAVAGIGCRVFMKSSARAQEHFRSAVVDHLLLV